MKMTESVFVKKYINEQDFYMAWGEYITEKACSVLSKTEDLSSFLKVPPKPRLKDIPSLLEKAFYRDKKYEDPYTDITDKVGVRFVVLILEDINKICGIIENIDIWSFSKDRDIEDEKRANPTTFTYQSDHYIVKNKKEFVYRGISIPVNTPCEIQIRTLLQHAYSELAHDTIYKPKTTKSPEVHRMIARSMALIETTDIMFKEVNKMILEESAFESLLPELTNIYSSEIREPQYQKRLNTFILDSYKDLLSNNITDNIKTFIGQHPKIKELILNKYDQNLIYRQPIILLLYYMITNQRHNVIRHWPLTEDELNPLFIDLGFSLN
jgi:putative GTP pyrophosphokinase